MEKQQSWFKRYPIISLIVGLIILYFIIVIIGIFIPENVEESSVSEYSSSNKSIQEPSFLEMLQQEEDYPFFVPRLEKECGLILRDINVEVIKDNVKYSGTSNVSGKLTNSNPTPIFDVLIIYGLYNERGVLLTTELIIEDEISPNETISFSKEKKDLLKPGWIYNAFAYRIRARGQEPDLDSQHCKSLVGYIKILNKSTELINKNNLDSKNENIVEDDDRGETWLFKEQEKEENPYADKNYVIEITGTEGLQFSGSIGGGTNSRSIDGTAPSSYEVVGWSAVAVIQKKGVGGTLTVTIKEGGKELNSQTTTAEYGVVTVGSG